MWERYNLKEKAKISLRSNYWKTVLVALLASLIVGIGDGSSGMALFGTAMRIANSTGSGSLQVSVEEPYSDYDPDLYGSYDEDAEHFFGSPREHVFSDEDGNVYSYFEDNSSEAIGDDLDMDSHLSNNAPAEGHRSSLPAFFIIYLIAVLLFVAVIVIVITLAVKILVLNPLQVGTSRFFLRNLNQPGNVAEVGRGFDVNYKENFKTIFFMDLYLLGWSLLFIIPGIVKSYEYRMIPYLLADDPTMTKERAFAESRQMMMGNKWQTFVLDLSFIPWHLLGGLTMGILTVFYVRPYVEMTNAALYEKLRYGTNQPTLEAASTGRPVSPYTSSVSVAGQPVADVTSQPVANVAGQPVANVADVASQPVVDVADQAMVIPDQAANDSEQTNTEQPSTDADNTSDVEPESDQTANASTDSDQASEDNASSDQTAGDDTNADQTPSTGTGSHQAAADDTNPDQTSDESNN